jgi:serine phosphatase RsbU (regulator of sigma subunit)/Tfp pilus assembly protein PilF
LKNLLPILLFFPLFGYGQLSDRQEFQIDSLQQLIKVAQQDTLIIKAWRVWDKIIFSTDFQMSVSLNQKIDSLCSINLKKKLTKREETVFLKSKGVALNQIGIQYSGQGDNDKSLEYFKKSLKVKEEIGDKGQIASTLNNVGSIYLYLGNYEQTIDYYTKSLAVREEIGDDKGIANSLNNMGGIYHIQGDYEIAIDYYKQSLKIRKLIEDKKGMASSLNNIGLVYSDLGDNKEAINYYERSLEIKEELEDKKGIAISLNNIGLIYFEQGDNDTALDHFSRSLALSEAIGSKSGISSSLNNIGNVYFEAGNSVRARDHCSRSLALAEEISAPILIKNAAKSLWKINKYLGKSTESLEMYELFIATRDTILSEDNQKAIIQQEYKYAYDKQAAADSVKTAAADKVKDAMLVAEKAENARNQQQQYFLWAGLTLALLFGGVIFNRFKLASKQKAIIEEQKQIVDEAYDGLEEAHKEITDSINYAERIQRSFLATKTLLDENLLEYFVFFQPKDVVSGDFYWAGKLDNGNFAIVNADSTGHGVPGAIMSILNISSIESAVKDKHTAPADIFNDARKTIIERLKKDGSIEGGKDGMDASLISFNTDKNKMTYVAAQNPIWIIRKGEFFEIKAEKMPIGKHDNDNIPFQGGEYDLQKGDQIYTLTDGFQDQFGGPKGKKFMIKRMREYLLSISNLPMKEQDQKLAAVLADWKVDLEQVDDICLIGVKV